MHYDALFIVSKNTNNDIEYKYIIIDVQLFTKLCKNYWFIAGIMIDLDK